MIRPAGQNGYRAIDLLRQHDARKGVRPGLGSEGEAGVGGVQHRVAVAVGAADGEGELALAAVAQGPQPAGDVARGSGWRVFVADDEIGAVAFGQQGRGLGVLARLAALDLDDFDGTQAQGPTARRGPGGVVQSELAFRRRA